MQFTDILGQDFSKNHLIQSATSGRIPHAQLFVGPEGCGTLPMAIAYAQYILCQNTGSENLGGNSACNLKFENLAHPDLHFIFPTVTTDKIKSNPKSIDFLEEWRAFVSQKPYSGLFDWFQFLGVEKKQGEIRVEDANEAVRLLSLKSYEGGYKVMLIWMADKMNIATANKLLKLLEEPPSKTLFLLLTEDEEAILPTIRSRCQVLHFQKLPQDRIALSLVQQKQLAPNVAQRIALRANGNYNKALQLLDQNSEDAIFDAWFVTWVRAAFRAKGNAAAIQELMAWSDEIAGLGREAQKKFLHYCTEIFRQALLLNYQAPSLVYLEPQVAKFKLENFAPFVHGGNIQDIFLAISDAIYHIERNGNAKLILADLSIQLTRFIHKK